jgi:hypothetical protein
MGNNLKETIDRMVAESIRRILPSIMNEVLLKTIAQSGVVAEDRPVRKLRKGPKRRRPMREQKAAPKRPRKVDLSDILDESAGSEFYKDPREVFNPGARSLDDDYEVDVEEDEEPQVESRLQSLPPAIRGLAEGMQLDTDEGEMWGDDEHDSAPIVQGPEIRDIGRAAQVAGVDFSRIKNVINKVSPPVQKIDRNDAKAKAQFEAARIQRMRESLNGGKPVE